MVARRRETSLERARPRTRVDGPWVSLIRDWFIVLRKVDGEKVYRNFRGTYKQCIERRDELLSGKGDFHSAWIIDETDRRRVR
jgi:hypothetical protein